ncbi:MAG: glutathione S-transferase N-terminal domain-containing protein [Burkholderiales bacterium]|nr:glutathione S-transferase N-terminal domain-containing protein [Burkholderiales bacterium]
MKLYGSLTSPYVRKVRVLIKEKTLPVELVVDDPWLETTRIPAMNPLGKVPALLLDDGEAIYDSTLVIAWLDFRFQCGIVPAEQKGYWDCMKWHTLANGILDAAVARVLESRRPAEKQMPERMAREQARIERALDQIESRMTGGAYLVGPGFTLADIALGVALQYLDFRDPDPWRDRRARLARWHAGIVARSSFAETLPPGFVPPS